MLAKQLKPMAKLYSPKIVLETYVKILFNLCHDNIFTVRQTASKSVYAVLKSLEGSPEFTIAVK
jgi:hypothetical protein